MEVLEQLNSMNTWLNDFLLDAGVLAPIFSTILVFLEGILAFLPLFVFITVNILTLGSVLGCLVSWIFTTLGCFTTFYLVRKGLSKLFDKTIQKRKNFKRLMESISNLRFNQLVLITAIPFTPSFFINLGAGLSRIPAKKYLYALIVGKIFVVIFWGYIGANIIECLTNPVALIKVIAMVVVAYIVGRIVNKKFNLDERF